MQGEIDEPYGSMEKVIQADDQVAARDNVDHRSDGGGFSKMATLVSDLRVELIMALYTLGTEISSAFVQNLIIEKICLEKNHTREMCSGHLNETLEEEVQGSAAEYMMSLYVLRLIPAIIISIVIGHWSDLHGRRQILLVALCGTIITYILYCVNAIMLEARPIYMVLAAIPTGLCGDYTIMMFGIFSIIRDRTSAADLVLKIAIIDGIEEVGDQIAPLFGAQIYERFGYVAVFITSIVLLVACLIYVALAIEEPQFVVTGWKRSFRDFLNVGSFFKNVTVLTDRREGNRRAYICANLTGIMLISMCYFGFSEIVYLFGRLVFGWDVVMYSYFLVYSGTLHVISYLILLPTFVKCFKASDTILVITGSLTGAVWFGGSAFVKTVSQLFGARLIGILMSFTIVSFRSITLKCVKDTEIGKITAVFSIAQTLGQILGRVVSTQVYVATLDRFPGAFFALCAAVTFTVATIFAVMYWDIKRKKEKDI